MSDATIAAASAASAASPPAARDVKVPIARPPSLVMKPASASPSGTPTPTSATTLLSLTSKEWVVPPRPKPGRKPATDTPPSRRKAQNRAAQRAFRERRAARVSELEEHLKQVEDENDKEQDELRAHIAQLENDLEQCRAEMLGWVEKCRRLEVELSNAKPRHPSLPPPPPAAAASSSSSSSHQNVDDAPEGADVGCGKCTLESSCQCIDDAFNAMTGSKSGSSDKRYRSPASRYGAEKRIKTEPEEDDCLEVDFTAMYSKPAARAAEGLSEHVSPSSAIADPCGFCSDSTPCICAEMQAEREREAGQQQAAPANTTSRGRGRPSSISQFTPPPSEGDVSLPIPAPVPSPAPNSAAASSCAGGPGTCAQCRSDPNSTLFCKSLAASRAQSAGYGGGGGGAAAAAGSGCCGGRASGSGGCCQSVSAPTAPTPRPSSRVTRSRTTVSSNSSSTDSSSSSSSLNTLPPPHPSTRSPHSKAGVTLTCADAYTTLSRHPAYERASGEIASWMPKLHASDALSPFAGAGAQAKPRPAMEIDAANVMAVLKDFDRRFGRNC